MFRSVGWLVFSMLLGFSVLGCSDEAQLDSAVDNYNEEVIDTQQEAQDATADGTVTNDELEDVQDERQDVNEAAGEVAEQQGDLIESETD